MSVKGVAGQLSLILDEYAERLNARTDDIMDDVASQTAADLRNTSPKKSGDYAKGWTVKKDKRFHTYIVHNRDHYRLTHLLNNGHVVANQFGKYGRVMGDAHIERAEGRAVTALFKKLESGL